MDQRVKASVFRSGLFFKKDILLTTLLSVFYLVLSKILIGYKPEQLVLVVIFNLLYYLSFGTRKFITGFSIFIIFWIVFDYMKAFPNYRYNTVHIESLYNAEKSLFGFRFNGQLLTPNEFWRQNSYTSLDILCGIFYLCWVPVPLVFAAYLFFARKREQFLYFALTFLLVNLIGFVGYYIYPAAPPWYVQMYGFTFNAHTPGNTAGLHRFDDFFQAGIFNALYAKSSNVFAAMPSLHSAYNLIVLYYGMKNRLGLINIFFAVVAAGIWFAAVYSSHHYVLDVLAGIACAIIGIFVFTKWIVPNKSFQSSLVTKFVKD
ncbi:MAG: phosphatase PAP2 family protein [Bacteroidota bacterium]|nr:phosphatase PAP2 family protein [Bacteroidota bacterium]